MELSVRRRKKRLMRSNGRTENATATSYTRPARSAVLTTLILKRGILAIFACALFSMFCCFFARFSANKNRPKRANFGLSKPVRNNDSIETEGYSAPPLLCSEYVPPRVIQEALGPRPRLTRPRPTLAPVDPCSWSAT